MKRILLAIIPLLALLVSSCGDDSLSGAVEATRITFTIDRPADLADDAVVARGTFTLKNVSSALTSEWLEGDDISVIPGLYDITYTAQVTLPNGTVTQLKASRSSVIIPSGSQAVNVVMQAYNNRVADDLIIAEVFFSGTLQTSGNQYNGDDYVKLYNNTDHVIYADGITFWESKFTTVNKYVYTPDIMSEAVTIQAVYTVPGSGTDHPVQPGEYFLLADTGIDHRTINPNSFDLSTADFEWYDVSTSPSNLDIDSPTVPNLDKWYCYTLSFFILHNRGFKAYGISRIPVDRDTYLRDYLYTYDYEIISTAGVFPMEGSAYRMPNDWVVDAVCCSVASTYAWNVVDPSLDSGWTHCGSIDKDPQRYFRSVRRKVLYLDDNGTPVLKDTNNSTDDFNADCIPSEIELQGTAIDANGTPCTSLTYDGKTAVPADAAATYRQANHR
jgi:hypothetical protein